MFPWDTPCRKPPCSGWVWMGQDGAYQATEAGHTQGSLRGSTDRFGINTTKGKISPCSRVLRDARLCINETQQEQELKTFRGFKVSAPCLSGGGGGASFTAVLGFLAPPKRHSCGAAQQCGCQSLPFRYRKIHRLVVHCLQTGQ